MDRDEVGWEATARVSRARPGAAASSVAVVVGEVEVATAVADLLARRGHRVLIRHDLAGAEALVDSPPDLLVVGERLSDGASGLELVARLRRLEPADRLAVLALVGPDEEAVLRAYAAGADDAIARSAPEATVAAKCTHLLQRLHAGVGRAAAPSFEVFASGELAFDRYRVEGVLGRGGFGAVYAARDETSGAAIALKVAARRGEPDEAERFVREGYCLAAVRSPHVVRIVELGRRGDVAFCAMERVEGATLHDHVTEHGSCGPEQAMRLLEGLAHALAALAARDLVHRDLKPLNVILRGDRFEDPVLIDFGLTKRSFDRGITSPDILLGSPGYVAPEQLSGPADARSDLFALGQVVLFALNGFDPFPWLDRFERIQAMARKQTPIPAGLPPRLTAVLDRLTQIDPADRYRSARALLQDLGAP